MKDNDQKQPSGFLRSAVKVFGFGVAIGVATGVATYAYNKATGE